MGRLPTTVNFPNLQELVDGKRPLNEFFADYASTVQYWIQRLIRRTNDELIENFGVQTHNVELVLSGTAAKLGVNAATRLNKLMSLNTTIDPPNVPANSQVDVSLTFTGAVVGSEVTACPHSAIETGLVIASVWADAIDTVKIRLVNVTGAAIDPAPRTWRISVRNYD